MRNDTVSQELTKTFDAQLERVSGNFLERLEAVRETQSGASADFTSNLDETQQSLSEVDVRMAKELQGKINDLDSRLLERDRDAARELASATSGVSGEILAVREIASQDLTDRTTPLETSLILHDRELASLRLQIATLNREQEIERKRRELADTRMLESIDTTFSSGTDYRAPDKATTTLAMAATAIIRLDGKISVIGHADVFRTDEEIEASARNRADRVKQELASLGVDEARMKAVSGGALDAR